MLLSRSHWSSHPKCSPLKIEKRQNIDNSGYYWFFAFYCFTRFYWFSEFYRFSGFYQGILTTKQEALYRYLTCGPARFGNISLFLHFKTRPIPAVGGGDNVVVAVGGGGGCGGGGGGGGVKQDWTDDDYGTKIVCHSWLLLNSKVKIRSNRQSLTVKMRITRTSLVIFIYLSTLRIVIRRAD